MNTEQTKLYSRQIGAVGSNTMNKLLNMKVCLVGAGAVGQETIKCLSLLGIQQLHIYDPTIITKKIKNSIYYCKDQTQPLGKNGQLLSLELNSNVDAINITKFNLNYLITNQIDCVILTNQLFNGNKKMNILGIEDFCCKNKIKFIVGINYELYGYITTNFSNHTILDIDGEPCESGYIEKFSIENNVISIDIEKIDKNLLSNKVKLVSGSNEIIGTVINSSLTNVKLDYSSIIQLFLENNNNIRLVEYKESITGSHRSINQKINEKDYKYISLSTSFSSNTSDTEYTNFTKYLMNPSLNSIYNEYANLTFFVLSSIIAGIISHEVIKITGKYTPLDNDIFFDLSELRGKDKYSSSYSNKNAMILDKSLIKKIRKQNIFMIGAGALGCEISKNLGMLDFCTGIKSELHITDMDTIELSNLNRQFLFRNDSIGKNKSSEIVHRLSEYTPDMKTRAYIHPVGKDNEKIFNSVFWKNKSILINALDNVEARKYVDSKCVEHKKPLFESGTLGTKCNTQIIIPHKTATYSEVNDLEDKSIPMCTIRSFPNKIEHCIEWGLEIFNNIITQPIQDINKFINNRAEFMAELVNNENSYLVKSRIDILDRYLSLYCSKSMDEFIQCAYFLYNKYFTEPIHDILHTFPIDLKDENGNAYWSGKKLKPDIIDYKTGGYQFTKELYNVLHHKFKLESWNDAIYRKIVENEVAKEYVCKLLKIDEIKDEINVEYDIDINNCIQKLFKKTEYNNLLDKSDNIYNIEYDKDNDILLNLMSSISNLRANIYHIDEVSNLDIKLISGRIIPALCTTTTVIAGFVVIEILKYLSDISSSDSNINLGINQFLLFDSQRPKVTYNNMFSSIYGMKIKTIPYKYDTWSSVNISCSKDSCSNLLEIVDILKDTYKINVNMLTVNNKIIYNSSRIVNKSVYVLFNELNKDLCENIIINICSIDESGIPVLIPPLILTI
jgi:molybdopterin/thiamine biosynthesis adenylyltransferase